MPSPDLVVISRDGGLDGPARARLAEGGLATAALGDRTTPTSHHPQYGVRPTLPEAWQGRLHFTGSETSFDNGGLIEGALQQGLTFAHSVLRQLKATGSTPRDR